VIYPGKDCRIWRQLLCFARALVISFVSSNDRFVRSLACDGTPRDMLPTPLLTVRSFAFSPIGVRCSTGTTSTILHVVKHRMRSLECPPKATKWP
jgi:hypothetical protein